jgi:hypothetical protein
MPDLTAASGAPIHLSPTCLPGNPGGKILRPAVKDLSLLLRRARTWAYSLRDVKTNYIGGVGTPKYYQSYLRAFEDLQTYHAEVKAVRESLDQGVAVLETTRKVALAVREAALTRKLPKDFAESDHPWAKALSTALPVILAAGKRRGGSTYAEDATNALLGLGVVAGGVAQECDAALGLAKGRRAKVDVLINSFGAALRIATAKSRAYELPNGTDPEVVAAFEETEIALARSYLDRATVRAALEAEEGS